MAILSTDRLELVPWSAGHDRLLARLAVSPSVVRHVGDGLPWSDARIAQVNALTHEQWADHGFGWRVMVQRDTAAELGFIGLNYAGAGAGIDAAEYEIGWWLDPRWWGRGLAREGAAAVRDEAFTRLGAPSIVARIHPENSASLKVAAAIGLTPETTSRGRGGEPIYVLRLTAERWRAQAAG